MRNCGNCAISDCSLRSMTEKVNGILPIPGNSYYRMGFIHTFVAIFCVLFKKRGENRYQLIRGAQWERVKRYKDRGITYSKETIQRTYSLVIDKIKEKTGGA